MTPSDAIDEAVALAEARGLAVREVTTDWTKVHAVVHMATPLDHQLRTLIAADNRLRFWEAPATPHSAAEHGFIDDLAKVAVTFPLANNALIET